MRMLMPTLKLISLTSKKNEQSLFNLLSRLGEDISIVNSSAWLQRRITDSKDIIVLVLPESDISVDEIINAMTATPNSLYLTIFPPPVTEEISLILNISEDCCTWGCDESELAYRLHRISLTQSESSNSVLTHSSKVWTDLNLIGTSKVFKNVRSIITRSAMCDAAVLIEGETGCGKEMVARAIHYLSCRKDYPFIPINCGAIPDHLIENELFGHEKGAYNDAKQSYVGSLEQADKGTLFLDEIEALSTKGQVTLLRFIEEKIIKPLGAKKSKKINVRIIAASNTSLENLIKQDLFRKDLLYRLNLLYVYLPPLNKREGDIQYLAEFFMQKYRRLYQQPSKQIHPDTEDWMIGYDWPGNVRELENFIHRAFLISEDKYVRPEQQDSSKESSNSRRKLLERRQSFDFDASFSDAKSNVIEYFEKQYLSWLITRSKGNVTLAANVAQKERRALGKLLKKHDIDPGRYRNNG